MADLKIRIGASVNADMGAVVFEPLVKAAQRARGQIRKAMDVGPEVAKDQNTAAQKALAFRMDLDKKAFAAHLQRSRDAAKLDANARIAADKNATAVQIANIKARAQAERDAMRMVDQLRRDQAQQRQREAKAERVAAAQPSALVAASGRFLKGAASNAIGMAGRAAGVAADIARGAGVNFDIGSAVAKATHRETAAIDLINSTTQGDKTASQRMAEAKILQAQAAKVGQETAIDPGKLLTGMQQFASITGDLEAAKASMKDLAVLASGTGSNFEEIMLGAGKLNAQLEGTASEKAPKVLAIMRALSAQGQLGAIEMKDQAKYMGILAAQAGAYKGDLSKNVIMLGAMTQIVMQKGGVGSAAQAFTSLRAFTSTFNKSARRKELAAAGVKFEGDTGLNDVEAIIKASIKSSVGKDGKVDRNKLFGKEFADVRAQAPLIAGLKAYTEAGGGQKGLDAISEMFKPLREAMMKESQIKEAHDTKMQSTAAKAEIFQQKLDRAVGDMADKVIPQLLVLAPEILKVTQAFTGMIEWATANPFKAVAGALSASILKAGIAEAIQMAAQKALLGGGGGSIPGLGGAGGGAGMGATGAGGALGAMVVGAAAFAAAAAAIYGASEVFSAGVTKFNEWEIKTGRRFDDEKNDGKARDPGTGKLLNPTPGEENLLDKQFDFLRDGVVKKPEYQDVTPVGPNGFSLEQPETTKDWAATFRNPDDTAAQADALAAKMPKADDIGAAVAAGMKGGTLQVNVLNMPSPGAPGVNPFGRTGP